VSAANSKIVNTSSWTVYNFYGAMITIIGCLLMSIAIVKAFTSQNFTIYIKNWPQNCVFYRYQKCKIVFFGPPKGTSLRESTSFSVLIVEIGAGHVAVGCRENQKTSRVT